MHNSFEDSYPEIAKEWHPTMNGSVKPCDVLPHSNKKMWWLCSRCGNTWEAKINSRSRGAGCPFCSGRTVVKGVNDFASQNPKLLSEWDFMKNQEIDPTAISSGSHKQVWWKCIKGHSWKTAVRQRTSRNNNCPVCAGKRIANGYNDLATKHPELLEEWDYKKNIISPHEVGVGNTMVYWKCRTCGNEWAARIGNRVKGSGCPKCAKMRSGNKRSTPPVQNSLAKKYPELLSEWDYEKNEISPESVYPKSSKKVWWICTTHQMSYFASVGNRVNGSGCPICANKIVVPGINDFRTWCIKEGKEYLLEEWDYYKNTFSIDEVSPFSGKLVYWKCKNGHEYRSVLSNRSFEGTGCPICRKYLGTSFPEQAFFFYIKSKYKGATNTYTSKWLGSLELDIYIPEVNTAIEYDGVHWHQNKEKNDIEKTEICRRRGISLIRIRENGLSEIPNCINVFVDPKQRNDLNRAIEETLNILNIFDSDVDTDRDTYKIVEQFDLTRKENSIANRYPKLVKEWDYEKNGDINPSQVNYGSTRKFWWKCPICGKSYLRSANARTNQKQGCPNKQCVDSKRNQKGNSTRIRNNGSLLSLYPEIVAEWDYEKNEGINPIDVTGKSHKKVWWICTHGHSFQATIYNRTNNNTNCPYCAGKRVVAGKNDFGTEHPDLAKEWHPVKNGTLKPADFSSNSKQKIWWFLPYDDPRTGKHFNFEWEATIAHRTNGQNCPYLSGRKIWVGFNDLSALRPDLALEWDTTKNEGISPQSVTCGSSQKIWWKCQTCGHEWETSVASRVKGAGCPNCYKKAMGRKVICVETQMVFSSIKEAAQWANINPSEISNQLAGRLKEAGGYHWIYSWK